MKLAIAISLLTSFAPGLLLSTTLLRGLTRSPEKAFLLITLGCGFGIGVSSLIYYVYKVSGVPFMAMAGIECVVAVLCAAAVALRGRGKTPAAAISPVAAAGIPCSIAAAAFVFTFIREFTIFIHTARGFPYGGTDALQSYSYRAVYFVVSGSRWPGVFSTDGDWYSNLFRPLCLTNAYARTWEYAGTHGPGAPVAFALFYTLGAVILLVAGLRIHVKGAAPFIAGLALTGTPIFFTIGAIQVADIPIAFYLLAATALATLPAFHPPGRTVFISAMVPIAFAAWTKSEGIIFACVFLAVSFVFLSTRPGGARAAVALLIPAAAVILPVAAFIAHMFIYLKVGETRFAGQKGAEYARILDARIWVQLFKHFIPQFINIKQWNIFPLALTAVLPAIAWKTFREDFLMERICFFSLLITLCALFASCVSLCGTDYIIYKHASFNLYRFILQIYPSMIYLAVLVFARSYFPPTAAPAQSGR